MLKWLDFALVLLIATYLIVLSVVLLIRIFRGQKTGYGQASVVPESWRRWMLDEKPKNK